MSSEALDFLTDYKVDEVPSIMEVRTERIDPISSNTTDLRYTFRLEPNGFLDSNTLLQFKLNRASGATNDELRVNSWNGALGAIKRVIFRVGDFILNDTDGVNQWSSWANLAPKRRTDLNHYEAWYLGNQLHSGFSEAADDTYGQYQVDTAASGYDYDTPVANSLKITTTSTDNFKYGIPLGLLIPALKDRKIPLYLFSQYRIYIEVEFHPASVYMNSDQATSLRAGDSDIDAPAEVQLLADYLIYPSSVLEKNTEMTQKEGGLVLDFLDIVKIERQLVVSAGTVTDVNSNALYLTTGVLQDAETSQEFRIGQEGREVHTILMWKKDTDKQAGDDIVFLEQRCDSIARESIQWSINGIDVYPEPLVHRGSQYDANYLALGYKDLQVERPLFFGDVNSLACGLTERDSGLQGQFCTQAYDCRTKDAGIIGSGTLIGRYPIVCKYKATPATTLLTYSSGNTGTAVVYKQDGTYDIDFFVAVSRRAVIESVAGEMTVSVSS